MGTFRPYHSALPKAEALESAEEQNCGERNITDSRPMHDTPNLKRERSVLVTVRRGARVGWQRHLVEECCSQHNRQEVGRDSHFRATHLPPASSDLTPSRQQVSYNSHNPITF